MNKKIALYAKILLLYLLVSLLSACQNSHKSSLKPSTFTTWNKVSSWKLIGKMAINDGKNNGSGKISWQQDAKQTIAQFKAPLGQGSWKIIETNKNAELISTKTGSKTANNAQLLISYELGWDFPWQKLKYWLRAYKSNEKLLKHNQPRQFIGENGWHISFDKWIETPAGLLPKKIKASKPPYSVKLFIYSWEIQ